MYKLPFRVLSLIIPVVFLIIALLLSVSVSAAEEKDCQSLPLIHTSGSGTIKAAPDRANIDFSIITKNPDVKTAQKENARKMESLMSALRDQSKGNLSEKDIGTSSYSISEIYSPDDALKAKFGNDVTIYEVSNTISIETPQIDRVGDIIDIAVTAGANEIKSLSFDLSPEKRLYLRNEALKIAVAKAHSDAVVVTGEMGKTLGDVYEITVDEGYQPPVYYNKDYGAKLMVAAPSTPIEPGTVEVTAKVTAGYSIQ